MLPCVHILDATVKQPASDGEICEQEFPAHVRDYLHGIDRGGTGVHGAGGDRKIRRNF